MGSASAELINNQPLISKLLPSPLGVTMNFHVVYTPISGAEAATWAFSSYKTRGPAFQIYSTKKKCLGQPLCRCSWARNITNFPGLAQPSRNSDYAAEIPMAVQIKLPASIWEEPACSPAVPRLGFTSREVLLALMLLVHWHCLELLTPWHSVWAQTGLGEPRHCGFFTQGGSS